MHVFTYVSFTMGFYRKKSLAQQNTAHPLKLRFLTAEISSRMTQMF